MKEKTIVQKLVDHLAKQGILVETEYRNSDIYFEHNGVTVGVEVKSASGNPFHGLGQALSYLEFADEVWLVLPERQLHRIYSVVQKYRLPVRLMNTADFEFTKVMEGKGKVRYACIFPDCGESFPDRNWLASHMSRHGFHLKTFQADMKELEDYRRTDVARKRPRSSGLQLFPVLDEG
ncbi:TBPIP family protein [Candidatus Bathyarchaeota archaeon]|nr:TBPIP family protein [Candidatus Bathyarchaeota archaeon]